MTKHDHARMAWNLVPVVFLILAYMCTENTIVAMLAVLGMCWWLGILVHTTNKDDMISTWYVGDGHGNGETVYAHTEQEAISKVARSVFDLQVEHLGYGKIK